MDQRPESACAGLPVCFAKVGVGISLLFSYAGVSFMACR